MHGQVVDAASTTRQAMQRHVPPSALRMTSRSDYTYRDRRRVLKMRHLLGVTDCIVGAQTRSTGVGGVMPVNYDGLGLTRRCLSGRHVLEATCAQAGTGDNGS
jgi:hypothetical protein